MPRHGLPSSAMVALVLVSMACDGGREPAGPAQARRDGIRYSAEIIQGGPEILIANARIANRGDAERRLRFPDACVALFRFYDAGDRLVWDQHEGNKTCIPPAVEITLSPAQEESFRRFAYAPVILAHFGLPAGRYRVTLYLRPEGEEIVELELGTLDLVRLAPFDGSGAVGAAAGDRVIDEAPLQPRPGDRVIEAFKADSFQT